MRRNTKNIIYQLAYINFPVDHFTTMQNRVLANFNVLKGQSSSIIVFKMQNIFSSGGMVMVNEVPCKCRLDWISILKGWPVLMKPCAERATGFQVVSLGFSWNSSKFQNLRREEAWNFPMFLGLYKELEPIWVESSEFFIVLGHLPIYYIRRLAPSFARCFALLSLRSNTWGDAQNFPKSQSLYGGSLEWLPL